MENKYEKGMTVVMMKSLSPAPERGTLGTVHRMGCYVEVIFENHRGTHTSCEGGQYVTLVTPSEIAPVGFDVWEPFCPPKVGERAIFDFNNKIVAGEVLHIIEAGEEFLYAFEDGPREAGDRLYLIIADGKYKVFAECWLQGKGE